MEEKINDRRVRFIVLGIIAVLFVATRLYKLDTVPFGPDGLHIDEAEAAYDAVCIRDWGVDQFLVKFPPYFRGYGGGQNALYTYLAVIVLKFLPMSTFSFRLVAVLCAIPAFFSLYDLSYRLFQRWSYAVISISLMTIFPVYLMSEHWGLECYLFLSLVIISMDFLVRAVQESKLRCFVLSGVFWGISLYTYAISWPVIPIFLFMALVYLIYVHNVYLSQVISLGIPTILFGIPLFIQLLVMTEIIAPFSLPFMDFFPTDFFRVSEMSLSNIPYNIMHSSYALLVQDGLIYNAVPQFGTIYYVSIPFMLIGGVHAVFNTYKAIRARQMNCWYFIVMFYLVGRFITLCIDDPNINRMNHIYFPLLLFTVLGIKWTIEKLKNQLPIKISILFLYAISFLFFAGYYYSESGFEADTAASIWRAPTQMGKTLAELENQVGEDYTIWVIANEGYDNPLMFALYTETSPYDYNKGKFRGCEMGVPNELDLSGRTVYFIDEDLHHITDYLESVGFIVDRNRCPGFAISVKIS